MSVCVVNLAAVDPKSNGGLSRVAKELSRVVYHLSREQPLFHPVFAVRDRFASQLAHWIEREATIIPIDPQHPGRPLLRGLNPDLILSPLFGMESFDQIREFDGVRHVVLTGGRHTELDVDLVRLITQDGLPADRVHDLGYVTDAQMVSLYRHAEALLFTSSCEGFGMPILEAMRFGCPVICAPTTAIPEIAGDAALYVDSGDPQVWARAILAELPQQRATLIARGTERAAQFGWQQTREAYREFLVATAPDVFGAEANTSTPIVSLSLALEESRPLTFGALESTGGEHESSLLTAEPLVDLNVHPHDMQALLREEHQSARRRVPVLGLLIRPMIRVRNMGRFWRFFTAVASEILRRQALPTSKIDACTRN